MRFDLYPDPHMAPTVGLLHATVKDTYERLKRLASDMTIREVDYRGPDGSLNSTAQLLRHLAVVDLHWVSRITAKPIPAELNTIYGPMRDEQGRLPLVQGVPVQVLLDQYDEVQRMFHSACLTLTDDDLDRQVSYESGASATIRWGIWHIADHSRYHQAHIAWLKKWARTAT